MAVKAHSASKRPKPSIRTMSRAHRKPKYPTSNKHLANVYEYSPASGNRREHVEAKLTREEMSGFAHDEEDEEDDSLAQMKQRLVRLVQDEDVGIGTDDDEEIQSDEAFEESDEERFAEFRFGGKAKKSKGKQARVTPLAVDLEEDAVDDLMASQPSYSSDEDGESGDPDDFFDALDILDGKADLNELQVPTSNNVANTPIGINYKKDRSIEESRIYVSDEDPQEDADAILRLGTFIDEMDNGAKRKAPDEPGADSLPASRKRKVEDRNEAGTEGEFANHSGHQKLSLEDLLQPLAESASNSTQQLKKSIKALGPQSRDGPLAVPLPLRVQDRLSRDAAYQQTKTEVGKWQATMKRIREADHLSFPLQAPSDAKASNAELVAKFKPSTRMESSIDSLLKAAHLREEDLTKTEELQMAHLTKEEVDLRRQELRQMRELMFRADAKAKRVAKIKSKTYRKMQKKAREKEIEKLRDAGLLDEGEKEPQDEQLQREVKRARERATLRHKNTGKWAKAVNGQHGLDGTQRRQLNEQLDRADLLLRKMHGGSNESGEISNSDSDDDDDGAVKANALHRITQVQVLDSLPEQESKKGVFAMKFMQEAEGRRERETRREADDFIREMVLQDADGDLLEGNAEERRAGKLIFTPNILPGSKGATQPTGFASSIPDDGSTNGASFLLSASQMIQPSRSPSPLNDTANPWLTSQQTTSTSFRRKDEILLSKNSSTSDKSKASMKKQERKLAPERQKELQDAVVDISLDNVLKLPSRSAVPEDSDSDSDDGSERGREERSLKDPNSKNRKFRQRDIIALAFAGDNVSQEFSKTKQQETERDAPREVDATLPGWGSWAGPGVIKGKTPARNKVIKKVPGIDITQRADYKKPHVIISEKKDKRAARYQVKDLPYPYTSKAQFEQSLETPLGAEWNTRTGFQRGTLPRVMKKMGTLIEPVSQLGGGQ